MALARSLDWSIPVNFFQKEIEDKIDHYVSYRVFFLCEATKDAGDWRNYKWTRNQITPKQTILATDFQWILKEQFSFKFQDNLKI